MLHNDLMDRILMESGRKPLAITSLETMVSYLESLCASESAMCMVWRSRAKRRMTWSYIGLKKTAW